ncbi:Endonuclease/exonuclease/phosphatase [Cubamyces lactineus]|nr:Endonuclease/exonuclease/phosphatase [Cubamyces lactineus]
MGAAPKSGPSSPVSDAPPSPSALSSTSSSSSTSDMPPSVTTPSGDLLHPLKAKGWSFTKSKWISRYRCDKEIPTELRLLTWNVDFMEADSNSRILRILHYLQKTVLSKTPPPSCILLQEVDTWSLNALIFHPWVRKYYAMTPPTTEPWKAHYGNVTLVSRSIPFENPQMLVFRNSTMGRTAIFVDIPIRSPTTGKIRTMRIANTHLESLPSGTKMRPTQLAAIAAMLRADGIDGGVVGGDMNMIGDTADQNIHIAAGLDDACLFPHDPANHTWGYQPPTRFPPRRLDRVFFTGEKIVVDSPEVIGKGLRTTQGLWVSDHCGLSTTVSFTD